MRWDAHMENAVEDLATAYDSLSRDLLRVRWMIRLAVTGLGVCIALLVLALWFGW